MEQEPSKEELRETLSAYQSLLKSQGWEQLAELAGEQIETRKNVLLAMEESSLEDVFESVRLKAEIRAFKLWLELPKILINDLREELGYVDEEVDAEG